VKTFSIRAALIVFAALVVAWLAVGMRAVWLQDQAEAVIDRARAGPVPEAEVERAQDRLRKAAELSPDQGPLIEEGHLLEATGHSSEAVLLAHMAARDEPDNLQAWVLAWAADSRPKTKNQAHDEMLRLNPYIDVVLGLRNCIKCELKTP
jgi:hypothetical protein